MASQRPAVVQQLIELPSQDQTALDWQNQANRQAAFQRSLQPAQTGTSIATGILGPGMYKGGNLADKARVSGIGWPTVNGQVRLSGSVVVHGVVFSSPIAIAADGQVQLCNCIIEDVITMASGAKLVLSSSLIEGRGVIVNAGGAGDAQVIGNVRTSGTTDTNATVTAEVS